MLHLNPTDQTGRYQSPAKTGGRMDDGRFGRLEANRCGQEDHHYQTERSVPIAYQVRMNHMA